MIRRICEYVLPRSVYDRIFSQKLETIVRNGLEFHQTKDGKGGFITVVSHFDKDAFDVFMRSDEGARIIHGIIKNDTARL